MAYSIYQPPIYPQKESREWETQLVISSLCWMPKVLTARIPKGRAPIGLELVVELQWALWVQTSRPGLLFGWWSSLAQGTNGSLDLSTDRVIHMTQHDSPQQLLISLHGSTDACVMEMHHGILWSEHGGSVMDCPYWVDTVIVIFHILLNCWNSDWFRTKQWEDIQLHKIYHKRKQLRCLHWVLSTVLPRRFRLSVV